MGFLQIKGVGKSFAGNNGQQFEALRDVNLEIAEGEFVSLIGHSGCGKSTVLNLVAGLLPVTAGKIEMGGQLVTGPGPDRMVAFQNHSLLPWLTLRQNIRLAVDQVHKSLDKDAREALVTEHLKMVKLMPAADRLPAEVSGGMKQRCGIARALVVRPDVLLLDEPFGALDALTRANLQDELLRIWEQQRLTVMMITHDVDEALLLSDRIVMMSNGPAARVAETMTVDIPRPRDRLKAVDHPSYYRQRGELIYFLNKCKKAKVKNKPEPKATVVASSFLEKPQITVGFVPLVDAAPFAVAEKEGFFEQEGLQVTLSREPSWKAIADGIVEGRLDAAQMVVGMPLSLSMGTGGGAPLDVCTGIVLSRGGNGITFGKRLADAGVMDRKTLKAYLSSKAKGGKREVFGMVHPSSMHNLLFRDWLAAGGVDPERDLELTVIPPPQMVANLKAGNILGYCVGEPWNLRAVHEDVGRIAATDADIWPDHPEKVLGVTKGWAEAHPKTHRALIKALLRAGETADDPAYRKDTLAELLTQRVYVGGEIAYFRQCLLGPLNYGDGWERENTDLVRFSGPAVNQVGSQEMLWVLCQMARWGQCPFPHDFARTIDSVVLKEPLAQALLELDRAPERDAEMPVPLPFDGENPRAYLEGLKCTSGLTFEGEERPRSNLGSSPSAAALLG